MKPYKNRLNSHGGFQVNVPGVVIRPTKNSAGMSYTAHRSNHDSKGEILKLVVNGTCDSLTVQWLYFRLGKNTEKCPCCGNMKPRRKIISEIGKRALERLRRK